MTIHTGSVVTQSFIVDVMYWRHDIFSEQTVELCCLLETNIIEYLTELDINSASVA